MTSKLERKLGRIDWTLAAAELDRRCRAFDPFPGIFTNFRGARLKVHDLEVGEPVARATSRPGPCWRSPPAGIEVRSGGGSLAVLLPSCSARASAACRSTPSFWASGLPRASASPDARRARGSRS